MEPDNKTNNAVEEDTTNETDIGSSELGTKEYWDKNYDNELSLFQETGDPGDIWFGRDSVDRMVVWVCQNGHIEKTTPIIELGCGNGVLLIELSQRGFTNLTGIDYSVNGIKLAKAVANNYQLQIIYQVCDLLDLDDCKAKLKIPYPVCIDKGTYDAICLSPVDKLNKRNAYKRNVLHLLNNNGILIITSCNWTRNELRQHFMPEFVIDTEIPTPQFQFGGRTGSSAVSLILHTAS